MPRRQQDVAGPFQFQQQCARRHILGPAQRVAPVPAAAELFAEPRPAPLGMFGQEPLHLPDVLAAQFPSLDHHHACHRSFIEYGMRAPRVQQKNKSNFESIAGDRIIRWGTLAEAYLSRYRE